MTVTDHIAEQSKLTSIHLLGFMLNELAHCNIIQRLGNVTVETLD